MDGWWWWEYMMHADDGLAGVVGPFCGVARGEVVVVRDLCCSERGDGEG